MDLRTEEDVKVKVLLPYLQEHGYKKECIRFEQGIEVQEGRKKKTIFADLVVYASPKSDAPILLCETKAPNEILDKSAREQTISYARLLPRIAPLVLLTNGSQTQVYQTVTKNRLASLPKRSDLQRDIVNFVLSRDLQDSLRSAAKHELFIIDDVQVFKRILKSCHNEIRNNEGYDATVAFDEMSKVLFCKLYEEKRNPDKNRFRLSVFRSSLKDLGVNVVKQILVEAKADTGYAEIFDPASAINLQDRTIEKIVQIFENFDLSLTAFDVKGEAFEYFLGDTFTGGLGEYFTPRNVVEFMVDVAAPKIGDKVIDPFCGTGGFLIHAFEVVSEKIQLQDFSTEEKDRWRIQLSNQSLYGTDWKERTSLACKMNMMVHGDGSAGIFMHHGLIDVPGAITEGKFDLCITNPPFGSLENDPAVMALYELGSGRKSQDRLVLAVERSLRLVKAQGLVAIVVIDGILNNHSSKNVRDYIRSHSEILGIVSLNKETFEGYGARAKTSILYLRKRRPDVEFHQGDVFMSIVGNTGYAPSGDQIPGNELGEVAHDFKEWLKRGSAPAHHANSWIQTLDERLDAEFYRREGEAVATEENAVALSNAVSASLEEISAAHTRVARAIPSLARIDSHLKCEIGELLVEVTGNDERVDPAKLYRLLGVRWWGQGVFVREEKLGRDIKGKTLYAAGQDLVMYNRLFAFRGSFALTDATHEGAYASNEFPMFAVREGIADSKAVALYLVHLLNTPQFLERVDRLSTGSTKTSRNRFHESLFLKLAVRLPADPVQLRSAVRLLSNATQLRAQQDRLAQLTKEMSDSISRLLP